MVKNASIKDIELIVNNSRSDVRPQTDKINAKENLQSANLFGFSLSTVLQMIAMEGQTGVLDVYLDSNQKGYFCFVNGILYDAVCGHAGAEEAALRMMGWENAKLNVTQIFDISNIERKIHKSLLSLLMECSRRRDEDEKKPASKAKEDAEISAMEIAEMNHEAKEEEISHAKINRILAFVQEELGLGIVSVDICHITDGQRVGGIHPDIEAGAPPVPFTAQLSMAIKSAGYTDSGPYHLITIEETMVALIIPMGIYECGLVIDMNETKMGFVLNFVLPGILDIIRE